MKMKEDAMRFILAVASLLAVGGLAMAEVQQPYAGMQTRSVKALSPTQIEDLRAGRGMGLALAAELNGYPGPAHVLELAGDLSLRADQRERIAALFAAMKAETVAIGEKLIAQEAALDRLFADKTVTVDKLAALTAEIGATQGALRAAHLKYHLTTLDVLSGEQVRQYDVLRGYADAAPAQGHHGHQRRH
jgi:hypothetical protein